MSTGELHELVYAPHRQVERAIGYLETSFVPLRSAADLADLQAQADAWTTRWPISTRCAGWERG